MGAIIRGICRGTIEWVDEPHFHTKVPMKVEGLDMSKFSLANFYRKEQIDELVNSLKKERLDYIRQFKDLTPAIANALV